MGQKASVHLCHDVWVLYPSKTDKGRYVAHSLRTDQIGVGDCIVDAYCELVKAIHALLQEAQRDATIDIYQDAPDDIWAMLNDARKLPDEIAEIAALRLAGNRGRPVQFRMRKPCMVSPRPELIRS